MATIKNGDLLTSVEADVWTRLDTATVNTDVSNFQTHVATAFAAWQAANAGASPKTFREQLLRYCAALGLVMGA